MQTLHYDGRRLRCREQPIPTPPPAWSRIRVHRAGICGTDLEIVRGYRRFRGIVGHEFVGTVSDGPPGWTGRRVVGEITVACGRCRWCRRGLAGHCRKRRVLGIEGLDGCMAEYCCLPTANLHPVPEALSDLQAVFIEPLAAAYRILVQIHPDPGSRAVVIGDGRLGILCAWVLQTTLADVTLSGRHPSKLERARWGRLKTVVGTAGLPPGADLVVEASGSAATLETALALCRPRGTVVLKTTTVDSRPLNLTPLVLRETTLVGSRCGPFDATLRWLVDHPGLPLERLVTARYPLAQAVEAFDRAAKPDALKVLVEMGAD